MALFCVSIIVDDANDKCVFLINNGKFTLKCEGSYLGATSVPFSGDYAISEITKNAFTKLPIIEHARNKERMGIIENQIRNTFGLEGTPIRLTVRQRGDKGE